MSLLNKQQFFLTVLQMLTRISSTDKNMHSVACSNTLKSALICFSSFFCTGQLQFLQHQMQQQQQQMAMGAAAPQGGAPRQHTASQPRSKRKRSMPQPLPKSWQTEITLRTLFPSYTRTWMIHTVLFVCLTVETADKKNKTFVLSVSFSSWQICM